MGGSECVSQQVGARDGLRLERGTALGAQQRVEPGRVCNAPHGHALTARAGRRRNGLCTAPSMVGNGRARCAHGFQMTYGKRPMLTR